MEKGLALKSNIHKFEKFKDKPIFKFLKYQDKNGSDENFDLITDTFDINSF